MARQGKGANLVRVACLAGSFLAPLLSVAPALAEILPLNDMLRGIAMTPQQCAAKPLTMWVDTPAGGYCMRYYLSTVGGEGRWPTVFLQGDKLGTGNLKTGTFSVDPKEKDINTNDLQRMADMFSKKTGGPAIYFARIGIDGSSGYHMVRHSEFELQVTNAALNGIKQRHRYAGFHVVGQSGGGTLVGGLLALRQDIGCAVPGSGRLALVDAHRMRSQTDPRRTKFDASESVASIARNRARILVVTDPEDKSVPLKHQAVFVDRLRRAGGQAEQFFVQATDDKHHGTVAYSATAVAGCIRGESTQVIAEKLAEQVRTRVAAAKAKAEKQFAETTRQPLRPSRQLPIPQPAQVARLPQQPVAPAHQQPPAPTYQAQVPTAQPIYPQQRQYQAGYPQTTRPTYQAQTPPAQQIYPQQQQYQTGYPQYQQPSRPSYQMQVPTAQPNFPQQKQFQSGYQQYPQQPRMAYPAPMQAPPSSVQPLQPAYQQPPRQPMTPQIGTASPPIASPPVASPTIPTSPPAVSERTVRPAEPTHPLPPPTSLPSNSPHGVEPGTLPARQSSVVPASTGEGASTMWTS